MLKSGCKYISSNYVKFFENKNLENSSLVEYFLFSDYLILTQKENQENTIAVSSTEKSKKRSTAPIDVNRSSDMGEDTVIQYGTHRVIEKIFLSGSKTTIINSVKNGIKLETVHPKNEYYFEFKDSNEQLNWLESVSNATISSTNSPVEQFHNIHSLFPDFEKNDYQFFSKFLETKNFLKGQIIAKEGELSDCFYRVERGSVCARQTTLETLNKTNSEEESSEEGKEMALTDFLNDLKKETEEEQKIKIEYNMDLIQFFPGDFFCAETLLDNANLVNYVAFTEDTEVSFYNKEKVLQELKFRHSTSFKLWNKMSISLSNLVLGLRYLFSQKLASESGKALKPLTFEEQVFLLLSAISELERKAISPHYDNEAIISILTGKQVSTFAEEAFGGKSKIEDLNCYGSAKQMDFPSLIILLQKLEIEKLIKINSVVLSGSSKKGKIN